MVIEIDLDNDGSSSDEEPVSGDMADVSLTEISDDYCIPDADGLPPYHCSLTVDLVGNKDEIIFNILYV